VVGDRIANQAFPVSITGLGRAFPGGPARPPPALRDLSLDIEPGEILAIISLAVLGKLTDSIVGLFERWAIAKWA
jgi:ABC-type multidrug transport system fused ATPase/permease subunit